MFSLQKLAVFALIVAALWLAFRLVGHLERRRRGEEQLRRRPRRRRFRLWRTGAVAREDGGDDGGVETVACPRCGVYVAPNGSSCSRPDCPLTSAA